MTHSTIKAGATKRYGTLAFLMRRQWIGRTTAQPLTSQDSLLPLGSLPD
ncbi:MAG: hypothetical protein GX860_11070 [Alcaligenaceae bacterium]|nr:hypothetical protein [Alcaligenaceae bacterium]